ncbi:pseudaminic acid cytidylyltransferase [Blastochloris sulfoviridis]|uniref:Pseudaminic acid cytidylyltransferase n=2 Tax=Blastochloris sulfoviridis TaxID=50712 RepID=A0A5M6HI08_9HYPH|nr:pseudaminic acid cytidylyltransferase [Blastochloris sulfoviridis]KAA5595504.1 pseudaminic acid cytidylyltransferase [Blastochloris sulfoviridis]
MRVAIIPARGGSKRIPRKNIKYFAGKPMIAHSIGAALASGVFDRVIVSTDDAEIAEVAAAFGAEIPFVRPPDLADDHTTTAAVMKHAVAAVSRGEDCCTVACCLYATAPFVTAEALRDGARLLEESGCDYVFTATSYSFPIQRAIRLDPNRRVAMFHPEHMNTRSQDLEEAWHDAGQFYFGKSRAWLDNIPLFGPTATVLALPRHRVQDIDTPEDWRRAELMYNALTEEPPCAPSAR